MISVALLIALSLFGEAEVQSESEEAFIEEDIESVEDAEILYEIVFDEDSEMEEVIAFVED